MAKTTADRVLKGITQTYMDKTGNPSPTYGTAVQEIGDAIGGVSIVSGEGTASITPTKSIDTITTVNPCYITAVGSAILGQ